MSPLRQNFTFESIEDWSNVDSMKIIENLLQLGLNVIFEYVLYFFGFSKATENTSQLQRRSLSIALWLPVEFMTLYHVKEMSLILETTIFHWNNRLARKIIHWSELKKNLPFRFPKFKHSHQNHPWLQSPPNPKKCSTHTSLIEPNLVSSDPSIRKKKKHYTTHPPCVFFYKSPFPPPTTGFEGNITITLHHLRRRAQASHLALMNFPVSKKKNKVSFRVCKWMAYHI